MSIEKAYQDYCQDFKLIYSYNRNHTYGNLWKFNDFEILLNIKTQKYFMNLETIFYFESDQEIINYLEDVLSHFTYYLGRRGYMNVYEIKLNHILSCGMNINSSYDNLDELYCYFKYYVESYINYLKSKEEQI